MKYFLSFLLILFFISPNIEKDKSISEVFRDGFFNYITCLDKSFNYAKQNFPIISTLTELSYEKTYNKIMDTRSFTKHLVSSGETIDDIIKKYNFNINNSDLDDFREIIYKENSDVVSEDYNIQSGEYIFVPTE
ncbi:hypothetical protein EAI30_03750 [Romboutsia ilealis]|uniref:LysM domain-containing protein n=1 Tax=Romboutsia faecis TaxID=2764597 RepID=A0ABR7JL77_9FIRM|nr:hypothetical protein [Romboutsia faecis]MBC5995527.1 hypothetical protein [Romboutsia faecis]MRN23727.1 hypothetical protein [Romboutsia ilealis]